MSEPNHEDNPRASPSMGGEEGLLENLFFHNNLLDPHSPVGDSPDQFLHGRDVVPHQFGKCSFLSI